MSLFSKIESNLNHVRTRIEAAAERAGRDPNRVTLVAVTKSVGLDEIRALIDRGVIHFGENRVETAREKQTELDNPALVWHMIGNVQRRKTKDVLQVFDKIDALDRLVLADSIQARCLELDVRASVLVEVNVSGEAQKHGFSPEALRSAWSSIRALDRLDVRGLLTMAPYGESPDRIRKIFQELTSLAEEFNLPDVSMGMSEDFELAVEAGATEVRVGSALFE